MIEIGAVEAKNSLGKLLDRVEQGEEILITRHGRPIARVVPAVPSSPRAGARAAADGLRALAAELRSETPVTLEEIKAWREAGRR